MQHPEKYGYKLPKDALYQNVKTKSITVNETIPNVQTCALSQGFNYKTLKYHNPWLISTSLQLNNVKSYAVTIPLHGYQRIKERSCLRTRIHKKSLRISYHKVIFSDFYF